MSSDQGESISSETSNGYFHEAEVTWSAFDEEADTQSTQSTHMDVMAEPHSQGSLLLSHNEALAGIKIKNRNMPKMLHGFLIHIFESELVATCTVIRDLSFLNWAACQSLPVYS